MDLELAVAVNIQCKKHETDKIYYQVFCLNTEKLTLKIKLNTVDPDDPKPMDPHKIYFYVDELDLAFKDVTNSTIGEVPTKSLNNVVGLVKNLVLKPLNALGGDGIDI